MRLRIFIVVLIACICIVTYNHNQKYRIIQERQVLQTKLLNEWHTLAAKKKTDPALAKVPIPVIETEKKPGPPAA